MAYVAERGNYHVSEGAFCVLPERAAGEKK